MAKQTQGQRAFVRAQAYDRVNLAVVTPGWWLALVGLALAAGLAIN